jgi:hypothetical protein
MIGTVVPHTKGAATVTKRLMTEATNGTRPSTFYEATLPDGEVVVVHENLVHAVADGTYVPEPVKVKGPRKVSTKKQRAEKHVKDMTRQRMGRGAIIKALAQKLRVSRSTAQTYYYAVKK